MISVAAISDTPQSQRIILLGYLSPKTSKLLIKVAINMDSIANLLEALKMVNYLLLYNACDKIFHRSVLSTYSPPKSQENVSLMLYMKLS